MIRHTVQQGEDLASIARLHGVPSKKVWRAIDNEDLKDKRPNPDVLNPGDELFIERELREEECATEQRHRFRLKLEPVWLRLRFLDQGEPRASVPYTIKIKALVLEGTTDDQGRLEQELPHGTTQVTLRLGKDSGEDYILKLGELDPVTEPSGVQARLAHLGYSCDLTGKLDPQTQRALREFQGANDLKETGEADEATREALMKQHES